MFIGEYEHSLDSKNRIIIPSRFRAELGVDFIITKGLDKCLYIYTKDQWAVLEDKLERLPLANKSARAFVRFFFSGANELNMDKHGRVLINQPLLKYASIKKDVVSIGVSNRIEIWSRENWIEYNNSNVDFNNIAEQMGNIGI